MTVILLCGLLGAGKSVIAEELVLSNGFRRIHINSSGSSAIPTPDSLELEKVSLDEKETLVFSSIDRVLDFITCNWRQNFVVCGLKNSSQFQPFLLRPFVMILAVQAPVLRRFQRCQQWNPSLDLQKFLETDDTTLYDDLLIEVFPLARLTIANGGMDLNCLRHVVQTQLRLDERWTRPHWDAYFMEMAELASKRSNCMKRGVGCVIVREHRVVATGYNGTSTGLANCADGGCARCNGNAQRGVALDTCLCLHAEDNALLEAGRVRCVGATLYCTTAPCLSCSIKLIQCGIKRIVYSKEYALAHDASQILNEASVELVKFIHELPKFIDVEQYNHHS